MRFVHLSDSHLGFKQFGLDEREQDFYDTFEKTIDRIIELDVDFVIHSGDLFDSYRPSTNTLLVFQNELLKLKDAGIPFYTIAGNHDSQSRTNTKPPILLYEKQGLKIISINRQYVENGTLICGMQHLKKSKKKALKYFLEQFSELAEDYERSILVLHQGIDKVLPKGESELELDELPKNFSYYALGHVHDHFEQEYGKGKLVYPGSMEMHNITDAGKESSKGFCLVDMNDGEPIVEKVTIELPRKYYNETIEYENFDEELSRLQERIMQEDEKPLLDLQIVGGDFTSSDIYDIINEKLGDHVISLRPDFKPDSIMREDEEIEKNKILDPRTLLRKKVCEEHGWEELADLSIDLLENLSSNKMEEGQFLAEEFYDENFTVKQEADEMEKDD